MALQLSPATTFTINRILKDHTDSTTRYVQAVVYNSDTRAVLATKSLTDNGNRWFSASYKLPYDNVYQRGRFILIITTVYNDAGYTTKSDNYQQESEEYLILEPFNNHGQFGGGGGADIDYKKLREIVKEELASAEKPEPMQMPKPMDHTELIKEVAQTIANKIDTAIGGIPPPEKVDLRTIEKDISALEKQIASMSAPKTVDFTPVLQSLQSLKGTIVDTGKSLSVKFDENTDTLSASFFDKRKEEYKGNYLKSLAQRHGLNMEEIQPLSKIRESYLKRIAQKHGL